MEASQARFYQVYEQLIGNMLQYQILLPKQNQTLRPIHPQEFIETICKDSKQRDCIMRENAQYLKCITFPTTQGSVVMIDRNKVYNMVPQTRSAIFDALKELYWTALYGPELTGVAREIQVYEQTQRQAAYEENLRREARRKAASEGGNTGAGFVKPAAGEEEVDGNAYMASFMNKFMSPEVTKEFMDSIQGIVAEDKATAAGSQQNPMDILGMIQRVAGNEKMQKLFTETNEKTKMSEEENQSMLNELANDALSKMSPDDPTAQTLKPLLAGFLNGGGGGGGLAMPMDPAAGPGMMETVMKTLQDQVAKGKEGDLQHTVTMLAKNYTAPVTQPINDDDLLNLSNDEFYRLQGEMELD